jgi:hypothetical protein
MDDNVLLADGREAIAVSLADAFRKRLTKGWNLRSGRSATMS